MHLAMAGYMPTTTHLRPARARTACQRQHEASSSGTRQEKPPVLSTTPLLPHPLSTWFSFLVL